MLRSLAAAVLHCFPISSVFILCVFAPSTYYYGQKYFLTRQSSWKKNSIAKVTFLQPSFYDFWGVLAKLDLFKVRALFFWPFLFPHFSGIPESCHFLKCFSQLCCPQLVIEGKSQCSVQDFRHGTTSKQSELGRDGTLVFLGLVCLFMWHALSTKFKVPTYL